MMAKRTKSTPARNPRDVSGLGDLTPDPQNARRHNARNIGAIADSMSKVGFSRSIVIDEEGVVLAGNGTIEAAGKIGLDRVRVVDADGDEIIAVRRTGLTPRQKALLAVGDNRSAELSPGWDESVLTDVIDKFDIEAADVGFTENELDDLKRDSELTAALASGGNAAFDSAYFEESPSATKKKEKTCPHCGKHL